MYLLLGHGIANKSVQKFFDLNNIEYIIYDDNIDLYNDYNSLDFKKIKCVIKSGIISNDHKVIAISLKKGIRVISDLELFYEYKNNRKIIAISGTNGKSTTVSLLKHIISDIDLGGNIGIPVFDFVNSKKDIIIEVSSYMGEYLENFKPEFGAILNIYPSHLKHHKNFENYLNAKINIFKNMKENDVFFYNNSDSYYSKYSLEIKALKIPFNDFMINIDNKYLSNYQDNLKVAILIALQYGINLNTIQERLKTFTGLEHRIEEFFKYNNCIFVNDSKSTNIYALNKALTFYENEKVLLICGGLKKEDNYSLINIKKNTEVLVCGENREELYAEFIKRNIDCLMYENLNILISNLKNHIKDRKVILFSFGSESYDQFKNFEERGNFLKDKIIKLFQ